MEGKFLKNPTQGPKAYFLSFLWPTTFRPYGCEQISLSPELIGLIGSHVVEDQLSLEETNGSKPNYLDCQRFCWSNTLTCQSSKLFNSQSVLTYNHDFLDSCGFYSTPLPWHHKPNPVWRSADKWSLLLVLRPQNGWAEKLEHIV